MNKKLTALIISMCFIIGQFVTLNGQSLNSPPFAKKPDTTQISNSSIPFEDKNIKWDNVPKDIRNSNAFKRYEWFYRSRENEQGEFPKEFIQEQKVQELSKIKTYVQKGNKIQTTSDMWTNIGPKAINMNVPTSHIPQWGSVSGRIKGLAVHPSDPNTVYIGAAAGGIWKTVDGGTNWTDMSGDLNLLTFGAIAIDPGNPNTVYAGTGEGMLGSNNTTFEGDGLYKSTDGGVSWIRITNGFGSQTQFTDIEVSPHDSNILLASLGSGNWNNGFPSNEGVWRSTDAGLTWVRIINTSAATGTNGDAFEVAFHPTSTTTAYASTGNYLASGGFFISTNSGASFTASNTGLPTPSTIGRIQFAVSPNTPTTIYALIYGSSLSPYRTVTYKSTDGGLNWSQISSGVLMSGTYNGTTIADQGSYDLCLDISPTNHDNVFFGNVELTKTTDGSTISFVRKTPPTFINPGAWDAPIHVDIHKIKYAPSNSNVIYIGCDGGIYKSTDGGTTWIDVNNDITTLQFYRVASDNNNVNKLYGGAQDNGNFSTANKGATDWEFETSGDGMECFVDYSNSNNIFMSTQVGNLLRSIDGGASWQTVDNYGSAVWTAPYWQHPTVSTTIYAAINGQIRKSTNSGASWIWYTGLISGKHINSVAQSPVTTNNMLAVSSYYLPSTTTPIPPLYISSNEGLTWSDITGTIAGSGFSAKNIQKAIADPIDGNTFYLCRVSYSTGQVLKTTNFGTTWTDISGNLPKIAHNDLFVDPANTNHIYVANDFGVYWTNNGGTEWHKLSNGMPFVPVMDFSFYVNGSTRLLRAASHGRGVFEMQIDTPLEKIYVDLKVFLEGAYDGPNMNTEITENVPNQQPFNSTPWNYSGTEEASVTLGSDIVDWVLVELRTGLTPSTATTIVKQKAGLLKNDGTIVDADGFTNLNFDVAPGDYYIVIYHRNHLPIMTPTEITIN
ncbi:MAG: hypothetical protein KDC88_09865 [Ignavibacteriae bacterium]|nr:hypothetical protein [Ignavibacteriota bacterium]MCB9207817.1 hypothetical protein [Ignavibacteriales bacterium]